jgi:hypothetical protein
MDYDLDGYPIIDTPPLDRVFQAIQDGNCIPFFGAGASMGYSFNGASSAGILSGWQLTMDLLREAGIADDARIAALTDPDNATPDALRGAFGLTSYDLFKAADAFLFRRNNSRAELDRFLRRKVALAGGPRPIHTAIAQIKDIYTALTTNYDRLFEQACRTYGREVFKHVHEQFKPNSGIWRCKANLTKPEIIYHKMHGCEERDESMIITRADYIRYLANWRDPAKGMPNAVASRLPSSTLLFLGYGLADWNLLTIWEGVVASYPQGGDEIQSFAVLKSVSPEDRLFFQKRNIEPIECDLTVFAVALARKFKLEIPQLGIPKPAPIPGGTP